MMSHRIFPILLAFLALVQVATAEIVAIQIEQETQFGQSVFVTAPLPELGNDKMVEAFKLSPHDYPIWQATFDFPAGIEFTPKFYLRSDDPDDLPSAQNGTLIASDDVIATSPALERPIIHRWISPDDTKEIEIHINSEFGEMVIIPFQSEPYLNGATLNTAFIPPIHANQRDEMDIRYDLAPTPLSTQLRVTHRDVWWFRGQGHLYEPDLENYTDPRKETFTFNPSNFPSRTIRVQLPRSYDVNTTKSYPVIYAQDGQNVFSPGGPFGSWDMDITITTLTQRGEMPEAILIGIDNSSDRLSEYTPEYTGQFSGRGAEFLEMIRDELIPVVNARYRTKTGPENTTHIGSSLGGLLGYLAALEFDDTFGSVIIMSPSFWVNTPAHLNRAERPVIDWARIYIDCGTAGNSNDSYSDTIQVRDALIEAGHVIGRDFEWEVGLNEAHNEAAWRSRLPDALRWVFGVEGREAGVNGWMME